VRVLLKTNILLITILLLINICSDAQCTNYNVSVNGGAGAGQVSWELYNSSGVLVLSGGAPFNQNICLPDDCYTLWMYDTAGNGWANQDWVIEDFTGDFDFDTNLDDGSAGTDQFETGNAICGAICPPGELLYTIDVDDGNDASDIYWELLDSSGNIVTAGFAPEEMQICLPEDCYTLWMYDNTGDGWTGSTWSMEDDQGDLVFAAFLAFGSSGSESFALGNASCAPPCLIYTIDVSDGIDAPDVLWELIDSFGVVQATGGADESIDVCLLEGCYSLIMYDFAGDGWQEVVLSISEPTTGFVYQTFLVAGNQITETLAIGNVTCQDPVVCGPGTSEYTLSVSSGTNPEEISWYFSLNNSVVQGGGAPYNNTICMGNGCYYLHMFDSAGDGWGGATYVLLDPLGTVIASGTMLAGSSEFVLINIGGLDCTGTEPPTGGACGGAPPTSDCFSAPCVCDVFTFQITPSGPGSVDDIPPPGSISNPSYSGNTPWGGTAPFGCLLAGELNSYWMMFTIATPGTLEFSLGGGGQQVGFYDWAMWPYNGAASCNGIANGTLAPARCVWNSTTFGGAGLAAVPPPGGNPGNYAPPLNVAAGDQFIICMSNWSFVNALVTLDFFGTATIACNLTLPVEMLSFKGYPEANVVNLYWDTAAEINNDYFVVEHSTDTKEWIEIGVVPGHGTTQSAHHYVMSDDQPVEGMNYYRLKQFDYDGLYKLSEIVAINFNSPNSFNIYPNPAGDAVSINIKDSEELITVKLCDNQGRTVFERIETNESFKIDTSEWESALYFVQVITSQSIETKQLMIIH